jgi:hypothetical protein
MSDRDESKIRNTERNATGARKVAAVAVIDSEPEKASSLDFTTTDGAAARDEAGASPAIKEKLSRPADPGAADRLDAKLEWRDPEHLALASFRDEAPSAGFELAETTYEETTPIHVYEDEDGRLLVIDGRWRLELARHLRVPKVRIYNVGPISETEAIRQAISTALATNPRDTRETARLLADYRRRVPDLSLRKLAAKFGISPEYVRQLLAMSALPVVVQEWIDEDLLGLTHACEIATAGLSETEAVELARRAIDEEASVDDVDDWIREIRGAREGREGAGQEPTEDCDCLSPPPPPTDQGAPASFEKAEKTDVDVDSDPPRPTEHLAKALGGLPLTGTAFHLVKNWMLDRWPRLSRKSQRALTAELRDLLVMLKDSEKEGADCASERS